MNTNYQKSSMETDDVAGNFYDKYHTKNPVANRLMSNFLIQLDMLLKPIQPENILEVGCGEGYLTAHIQKLFKNSSIEGTDFSQDIIDFAQKINPLIKFKVANVLDLPFRDNTCDLIVACEVLEHIEDYSRALDEIERVGRKYFLFSVPNEPIWRILNMARLKYLGNFGNTPGHVNHWSPKNFGALISDRFHIETATSPFPWSMILCSKK